MIESLRRNWPEYLIEGACIGIFMISAASFAVLFEHPASPLRAAIDAPIWRRALMGVAMGLTACALIYSPWGQRSGAHMNPATTLTFLRLGKVAPVDALFYASAQFAGALIGLAVAALAIGAPIAAPEVRYVATQPGPPDTAGLAAAFAAEFAITLLLMLAVLYASNTPRLARYTGCVVACLVALYIALEAPISGMSMNPARSLAPALVASLWDALWIYFAAPILGMLAAAEIHLRLGAKRPVRCAKLHHTSRQRCIFRCGYAPAAAPDEQLRETKGPDRNPTTEAFNQRTGKRCAVRKPIVLVVLACVGLVAWLVFRPELLFVNQKVSEALPAAGGTAAKQPEKIAAGRFHDGVHATSGVATIYRLADETRVLRLTEFSTSNGPDVQVYLGKAADAKDNDTVKQSGFVNLGPMKGNIGDQNYDLPADVDLAMFHSVTIWCQRFGANFGTAPLEPVTK